MQYHYRRQAAGWLQQHLHQATPLIATTSTILKKEVKTHD